jgi:hypothetical protein
MRQLQHGKKPRGRGRKQHNPLGRVFDSSGPDVKIRGTASHVADKYLTLARDAQSSGDRIASENYLQHAEHYLRIIAQAQAQLAVSAPPHLDHQPHQGDGEQPTYAQAAAGSVDPSEDEADPGTDAGIAAGPGPGHGHGTGGGTGAGQGPRRSRRRRSNGDGAPRDFDGRQPGANRAEPGNGAHLNGPPADRGEGTGDHGGDEPSEQESEFSN